MARAIRLQYAGAVYHVMARGNQGDPIFRDVQDRRVWLETLREACQKTGWRIHAYVLMGNHYHLLLETPEANLVEGMKWLQGAYTQRHNTRHKVRGHLFQGRRKLLPFTTFRCLPQFRSSHAEVCDCLLPSREKATTLV